MPSNIIWFADPEATTSELVGGKSVNLARMTAAGFTVPPGFTVSTAAYGAFVERLQADIDATLATVNFADADDVERATAAIRAQILAADVPAQIDADLLAAYARLADQDGDRFVAVRSSGTAEDLADASFAGLHDTFLDIRGDDELALAVKRCWASMWSARATAYRQDKGFDHQRTLIAVVIQAMVRSEVAGVLFTGNPLTTATDEFVINASWGLGEAVVSGVANPDEYTVTAADLTLRDRRIGSKAVRFVRDTHAGSGVLEQHVPEAEQRRACLDDDQVAELAGLGRRVLEYYNGIPQDIEWGYEAGTFYLLQSRPITGVEFSWDSDVDAWQTHEFDPDTTWTRAWSDSNWTGAKTPLFYSLRAYSMTRGETWTNERRGLEKAAAMPYLRYYKAEIYYNCDLDREVVTATTPKVFRPLLPDLNFIPPAWQEEVLSTKLDIGRWLRMQARAAFLGGKHAPHNCAEACRAYIEDTAWHPSNLPPLERLSDSELKRYVRRFNEIEAKYCEDVWFLFLQHARDALCLLPIIVSAWYPDDPLILHDLLAGTTRPSRTLIENAALWRLSERIRGSAALLRTFTEHEGPAFFTALQESEEGSEFLAAYAEFCEQAGFRGHADRDLIFPRRVEDPWIDYRNFQTLLSVADPVDPESREHDVNARRDAAVAKIVAAVRDQPMGTWKGAAFKKLINYIHDFIVLRDDQRWSLDRLTLSLKMVLQELARRGRKRGRLDGEDDHFFLTKDELYDALDGHGSRELMTAKITARRRDWERNENKVAGLPLFMRHGRPADLGAADVAAGEGPLQGIPTSRGTVTGTARIVRTQKEIGKVRSGEILVCNSTDPGWTPVFVVVQGVVTETGGMLSHASCLSREYGLPSVQIAGAMELIPDGATITVHGDTGRVTIDDREPTSPEPQPTSELVAAGGPPGGGVG
jgi:rifampicin phosphotransferase